MSRTRLPFADGLSRSQRSLEQCRAGSRYAAGAHSNRGTEGNTRACYGAVELNDGGVQHNLTRLSYCGDLAPTLAPSASATFPAQGVDASKRVTIL
jgi:hypothetical protein